MGNLKQYQFAATFDDTNGDGVFGNAGDLLTELYLVDRAGVRAANPGTGFARPDALSYWTALDSNSTYTTTPPATPYTTTPDSATTYTSNPAHRRVLVLRQQGFGRGLRCAGWRMDRKGRCRTETARGLPGIWHRPWQCRREQCNGAQGIEPVLTLPSHRKSHSQSYACFGSSRLRPLHQVRLSISPTLKSPTHCWARRRHP